MPMTRSQMAFGLRVCDRVVVFRGPSAVKTSPNAEVKGGSRSWITNRSPAMRSPRSMTTLRACCTVRAPVGSAVTPARCSFRVPRSMKISTYSPLIIIVSTTRKSQAMIA